MSPKNAIKIINIQKSYSVHFGSIHFVFDPIWSYLVLFSPFYPLKFNSVQFDLIKSTLVQFGPFSPHLLYSVHIGPILSTSVHFGLIQSI